MEAHVLLFWTMPDANAQDLTPPSYLVAPPPTVSPTSDARPWIGIGLAKGAHGTQITQVYGGSPGASAGLAIGDEVTAIDETATPDPETLRTLVRSHRIGDHIVLHVLRGEQSLTLPLALVARPDSETMAKGMVGQPLPGFSLPSSKGPFPADSAALAGNVLVIELFATWCGPCVASMPRFASWQETYGERGLRMLSVSSEDWATIEPFIAAHPEPYTIAGAGGDLEGRLGSGHLPTLYVVDRTGVVRFVGIGGGSNLDAVEAAFKPLL